MLYKDLQTKYQKIPVELKAQKRWCLYILKKKNDGNFTKIPICSMTGQNAKSNDSNTWSNFDIACMGAEKYNADGLGFMFGDGYFGIDLDNHIQKDGNLKMSKEEFDLLVKEFTSQLNSYTEISQSGNGIHIICKGFLPEGGNRQGDVEMYDAFRFFAMTGNQYPNTLCEITDCTDKVVPLFNKHIKMAKEQQKQSEYNKNNTTFTFGNHQYNEREQANISTDKKIIKMSDSEVLETIKNKANDVWNLLQGFRKLNDESSNDQSLMNHLCFWCDKDTNQMERIFEGSAYFMSKDDEHKWKRNVRKDYKIRTIQNAVDNVSETYKRYEKEKQPTYINAPIQSILSSTFINTNGIIDMDVNNQKFNAKSKKIFRSFGLSDTENAEHFLAYYGEILHYNVDNKKFLIWNGKIWKQDSDEFINIKKLVDEFIIILKGEKDTLVKKLEELQKVEDKDTECANLSTFIIAFDKNITRISNQNGKNALINELKHLSELPINNKELDKNDLELNTPSGIVDLTTGEIRPHTKKDLNLLMTSVGISKKEPKIWLHFLDTTWTHPSLTEQDKKELIHFFQKYLGYCLTGKKNYEICVTLYGNGSNGKSVILGVLNHIFGNYQKPIKSQIIANTNANTGNIENAIANLNNIRLGLINELKSNATINAPFVKQITSHDEEMEGRFLYGNSFFFYPKFKPIIITNHKPKIIDTDNGIWRRMCAIPFPNDFEHRPDRDVNLNDKLEKEWSSILWWMIQGTIMYQKEGLEMPNCVKAVTEEYRSEMDMVARFINDMCDISVGSDYVTSSSVLFNAFKKWCYASNVELNINASQFKQELAKKGYPQVRTSKCNNYKGIKLNADSKGHSFNNLLKGE